MPSTVMRVKDPYSESNQVAGLSCLQGIRQPASAADLRPRIALLAANADESCGPL
jgi:hypothetical protein